jgi:hypothetical protein|nr:MAG TPA: major capsid protein [Caudoviricetes sp.]
MKPLNNPIVQSASAAMQEALKAGNEEALKAAFEEFTNAVVDSIRNDYEMSHNDSAILAQRGYRVLTANEQKFYEQWIENAKSSNPRQEFTDLLNDGMPQTIIEDVYRNLVNDHPLLNAISFTNVSYLTRWILNDHTVDKAVWGNINTEVSKKITSSFKIIEMTQCKLSCYAVIPKDMLELGPVYLDNYIRTILVDALACALENGIVTGTGKNMPIGLDRNISSTASVVGGEYPKKTAVKVKSFLPAEYGPLVAKMAKTEKGIYRKIEKVGLICNPVDYLNKVMPATTVLNAAGTYTNNIFPVPTEVFQSAELSEGTAILCLPKEYFMGLGSNKNGSITYDDSTQFLEDNRVYMIKSYANGRAFDDTVSLLLDISELDPAYITVKNLEVATV